MKNFYYDLQAELVKKYEDVDRIIWGQNHSNVFYTIDGITGWYIPKSFFIVNTDRLMMKSAPIKKDIESFIEANDETGYKDAYVIGTKKLGTEDLTILSDENGETEVLIKTKFFKKLSKECELKIKGEKDMVKIYWHDTFCGIICPLVHRG